MCDILGVEKSKTLHQLPTRLLRRQQFLSCLPSELSEGFKNVGDDNVVCGSGVPDLEVVKHRQSILMPRMIVFVVPDPLKDFKFAISACASRQELQRDMATKMR